MKHVLIVTSELLLREGIANILSREVDIEVMSTNYVDENTLIREIDLHNPDVLILDERMEYTDLSYLFDLLIDYPKLRVMILNVIDNKVNVYDKAEIEVSRSYDLISAIRHGVVYVGDSYVN